MPMQVYIIQKEREKLIYTEKYGDAYGNYYNEVLHIIVILIEKGHVSFFNI